VAALPDGDSIPPSPETAKEFTFTPDLKEVPEAAVEGSENTTETTETSGEAP